MLKNLLQFIGILYMIDLLGFISWAVSGQYPDFSGIWLGRITYEIIKFIINLF